MNNLTIYFNEKQICFLNEDQSLPIIDKKLTIISNASTGELIKQDFNWFMKQKKCSVLVYSSQNPEQTRKLFFSLFKLINAAGGFIHNEDGALFIFRNRKWDLPKGKIDKGETPRKAAIRECEEECGVQKLKIVRELPSTYHMYKLKRKIALKRTYWYEMATVSGQKLRPQKEEGITKIKWFKKKEITRPFKNTFPSIKDVVININWANDL